MLAKLGLTDIDLICHFGIHQNQCLCREMHSMCSALGCITLIIASVTLGQGYNVQTNLTVRFAVVLPEASVHPNFRDIPFSLEKVLPAIKIALGKCHGILPGANMLLRHEDSQCSDLYGPKAYVDMFLDETADVFLGPVYLYGLSQAARYSARFMRPSVTAGGSHANFHGYFRHKDFNTLTTMIGNYAKLFGMMSSMFQKFNFTKIGMMYSQPTISCQGQTDSGQCLAIMQPLFASFSNRYIALNLSITIPYDMFEENTRNFESLLKKRQNDSRSKYYEFRAKKNFRRRRDLNNF